MKHERILSFDRHEVTNGDFFEILKSQAEKKVIKLDQVVASPKAEKVISKLAIGVILAGVAYFGVHIILAVAR
jgi:uncharacterized protein (DUF2062 family)